MVDAAKKEVSRGRKMLNAKSIGKMSPGMPPGALSMPRSPSSEFLARFCVRPTFRRDGDIRRKHFPRLGCEFAVGPCILNPTLPATKLAPLPISLHPPLVPAHLTTPHAQSNHCTRAPVSPALLSTLHPPSTLHSFRHSSSSSSTPARTTRYSRPRRWQSSSATRSGPWAPGTSRKRGKRRRRSTPFWASTTQTRRRRCASCRSETRVTHSLPSLPRLSHSLSPADNTTRLHAGALLLPRAPLGHLQEGQKMAKKLKRIIDELKVGRADAGGGVAQTLARQVCQRTCRD
jgi:hypothetical protein